MADSAVRTRVGLAVCGAALLVLSAGCAEDGAGVGGATVSATPAVTASPGVRLSGDEFWATLPADVQASICTQVAEDPSAALDIAASYAAANPVFRSQLVKTIRAECP